MEHAGGTRWWSRRWVQLVAVAAVLALVGGVFALARGGFFGGAGGTGATPAPTRSATPSGSPAPSPTPTAQGVDYTQEPRPAWQLSPADLDARFLGIALADPLGVVPYGADEVAAIAWADDGARLVGVDVHTGAVVWTDAAAGDWRGCTALGDGTTTACSEPVEDYRWQIDVVRSATGERVRSIEVDYWPITVAGLDGDVMVAGYRCDADLACWLVVSRHPVASSVPDWVSEATTRSVHFPSYLFAESLVADGGLLGFGMNGGLLVVDSTSGAIRSDVAFDYSGELWPGGYVVVVDGDDSSLSTTVTDVSGRPVLDATGRAWRLWGSSDAAGAVVGVGKTAYALGDGAPLWRLQGDLSGPGIVGTVPEPNEYVEVIDDAAVHLVTQDVGAAATGYDLATGAQLWTGTLDVPGRWAPMGASVLATNGCRGTASGFDPATGEVFWRLEPVAGEVVEECEDSYRESFLLAGDVLLDSQDLVRAYAFPTP